MDEQIRYQTCETVLLAMRDASRRAREGSPLKDAQRYFGERFEGIATMLVAKRTRLTLEADDQILGRVGCAKDLTEVPAFLRRTLVENILVEVVFDIARFAEEERRYGY
jgi:hypothetical protein